MMCSNNRYFNEDLPRSLCHKELWSLRAFSDNTYFTMPLSQLERMSLMFCVLF